MKKKQNMLTYIPKVDNKVRADGWLSALKRKLMLLVVTVFKAHNKKDKGLCVLMVSCRNTYLLI